jgi:hypothetical protein
MRLQTTLLAGVGGGLLAAARGGLRGGWSHYLWSAADALFLTALLSLIESPLGPLLGSYLVLVCAAGLFFQTRLIAFTTVVSMLAYAGLLVLRPEESRPLHYALLFEATLSIAGLVVGYQVWRMGVFGNTTKTASSREEASLHYHDRQVDAMPVATCLKCSSHCSTRTGFAFYEQPPDVIAKSRRFSLGSTITARSPRNRACSKEVKPKRVAAVITIYRKGRMRTC